MAKSNVKDGEEIKAHQLNLRAEAELVFVFTNLF
jgi:hypothetical protein